MNPNIEESESDFVRLLKKVQANQASAEALLENPVFKRRLRLITMSLAQTPQDAEEWANDLSLTIWRKLQQFKPDYEKPYGNFFRWVQRVARNKAIDYLRRQHFEFSDKRVGDLTICDPQIDIESSALYHEVMAEFEKSINALPDREGLAIAYYLQGFTVKEISEKMQQAGLRKWLHDEIRAQKAASFEIKPRNVRVKEIRATKAKREFHMIVDRAITSGPPTMTPEEFSRAFDLICGHKCSKTTESSSRPGWESAKELLKLMQSPESKQGIQAAFEASPKALGRAAVEYCRARKIPVSTLATLLMEASTINVVGRVMNLTKDAA